VSGAPCRVCAGPTQILATVLWCVPCGLGWSTQRYRETVYDDAYAERFDLQASTELGRQIYQARIDLLRLLLDVEGSWLDVGCGVGALLEFDERAYGYEPHPAFMPHQIRRGVAQRIVRNGSAAADVARRCAAVAYFDSLEHIGDPFAALATLWAPVVVLTVPIVPEAMAMTDGEALAGWKHYRPDEHLWYGTRAGVIRLMDAAGYVLIGESEAERRLGRQDVLSLGFRAVQRA
jgi:hypothetical protein